MIKILVVDDMLSWREFHKTVLEEVFLELDENNYQIDLANYARDAQDKLYENSSAPYDLIITDLQMEDEFEPQYAGEWLVGEIKKLSSYKQSRIIISSGTYNIKQIADSLDVEYIPKRIACTDLNSYKELIIKGLK